MFLQINGIDMPNVTSLVADNYTITESNRNDNGDMVHEYITEKRKITAEFGVLTHADRQTVYTQLLANYGLSLSVTYNDPETGSPTTINCYVGDRSIHLLQSENGIPKYWNKLQLSLIEN